MVVHSSQTERAVKCREEERKGESEKVKYLTVQSFRRSAETSISKYERNNDCNPLYLRNISFRSNPANCCWSPPLAISQHKPSQWTISTNGDWISNQMFYQTEKVLQSLYLWFDHQTILSLRESQALYWPGLKLSTLEHLKPRNHDYYQQTMNITLSYCFKYSF